jgi:hypothetical protein
MISRVVGSDLCPILLSAFLIPLSTAAAAQERLTIDFENGAAAAGYTDVRIPGSGGTLFSLTDGLRSDTTYFWRVRLDYRVTNRNVISALAAPLSIDSRGTSGTDIVFTDKMFPAGTPLTAQYVFNSYRVTWRYEFVQNASWRFGVGVTGKVRHALTSLRGGGQSAEKRNVGFVPLVNFKLERSIGRRAALRLEGDALAAPQGRAEDVFAGLVFAVSPKVAVKAGYRLLEGGADVDEVYTFSAVHYASVGVIARF